MHIFKITEEGFSNHVRKLLSKTHITSEKTVHSVIWEVIDLCVHVEFG